MRTQKKCKFCDKKVVAKNLCGTHYAQQPSMVKKKKIYDKKRWQSKEFKEKYKEYVKKKDVILRRKKYDKTSHERNWNHYHKYRTSKLVKDRKKTRYKNDTNYRITCLLRTRLRETLLDNYKNGIMIRLLGCDVEYFKKHLESQFYSGMNWNNQGEWHIDHIIPCNSFDLSNYEEQLICWNYKNLRPLWKDENLTRQRKYGGRKSV